MGSENLELVRSIWAAWECGNFSSTDWAHPEIEYVTVDGPSPGIWTQRAGLAEGWREFLSAWEEFRVRADEYRELDAERILVPGTFSGRGKLSGLDVGQLQMKGVLVLHVRGRKVTKIVAYFNRDRGLADLGLAPDAGSPRS